MCVSLFDRREAEHAANHVDLAKVIAIVRKKIGQRSRVFDSRIDKRGSNARLSLFKPLPGRRPGLLRCVSQFRKVVTGDVIFAGTLIEGRWRHSAQAIIAPEDHVKNMLPDGMTSTAGGRKPGCLCCSHCGASRILVNSSLVPPSSWSTSWSLERFTR